MKTYLDELNCVLACRLAGSIDGWPMVQSMLRTFTRNLKQAMSRLREVDPGEIHFGDVSDVIHNTFVDLFGHLDRDDYVPCFLIDISQHEPGRVEVSLVSEEEPWCAPGRGTTLRINDEI